MMILKMHGSVCLCYVHHSVSVLTIKYEVFLGLIAEINADVNGLTSFLRMSTRATCYIHYTIFNIDIA